MCASHSGIGRVNVGDVSAADADDDDDDDAHSVGAILVSLCCPNAIMLMLWL